MKSRSRFALIVATLAASALAIEVAGCVGDDNTLTGNGDAGGDATVSPSNFGTFKGVIAGPNGESGVIDLTIASTATAGGMAYDVSGTARFDNFHGQVALTGTFHLDTTAIGFTGMTSAGYSFGGSITNGVASGSYTGPAGPGSFVVSNTLRGGPRVFCGALAGARTDSFDFYSSTNAAGAAFASTGQKGTIAGTIMGSHVHLIWPTTGVVDADIDMAGNMTGTWKDSTGKTGTLTASESACAAFGTGDAGADGGSDGMSDAMTDGGDGDAPSGDANDAGDAADGD
jgi:hypothetical protein